jgi:hypothetical protein
MEFVTAPTRMPPASWRPKMSTSLAFRKSAMMRARPAYPLHFSEHTFQVAILNEVSRTMVLNATGAE